MAHNSAEHINIFDIISVIYGSKKITAAFAAVGFVVSLVICLALPDIYISTASVMPPQNIDPLSAGISSKISGGLGGGMASSFMSLKSPADLWIGILKSRNVEDSIIERFKLKDVYDKKTLSAARKALKSRVSIVKSKEDIISISVEDKDPERAARMANAFAEELDRVNKSAVMTSGQRTRAFLEKRLTEAKADLAVAEDAIRAFQQENKAVKLDDQSKAIIDAIGSVKGQLMAKEVEYETLISYATPENPQVQLLRTAIAGLKTKLMELEGGRGGGAGKDIFIPTNDIPDLSVRYARLLRDAKVQQALFELLSEQYEMARIQEAKDSPTVQLLDTARPAERSAKPNRPLIVMLSALGGAFAGMLAAFAMEYRKTLFLGNGRGRVLMSSETTS